MEKEFGRRSESCIGEITIMRFHRYFYVFRTRRENFERNLFSFLQSAKDTTDFLCKLLVETNAGKVERAIEEAALRCAEGSEYIAEPEKTEMVEKTVHIRRRGAR